MTFVVGLTGGIGSGKTLASDHFATLAVPVIDADVLAREIVKKGNPTLTQLVNTFGQHILNEDNTLNRDALRDIAFSDPQKKNKLDAITHPAIQKLTEQSIQKVIEPYCIIVIPLLNGDSNLTQFLQHIISVQCDEATRIRRVQQRSKLSEDEVKRIIQTQISDQERNKLADDIIENDGSKQNVRQQVEHLHQKILGLAGSHAD